MNESNINHLLKLYEEGKATDEQRRIVEDYLAYRQQQSPKRTPGDGDTDDDLQGIMEKIRIARGQTTEAPVYEMAGENAYPFEETGEAGGRMRRRRITWLSAASILVFVAVGAWWRQGVHQPVQEQVAVTYKTIHAAPGKMIHLLLSDSSELWLNAGGTLRYPQPFDEKLRKLELLDGEAFFSVHPDPNRGFEVQSAGLVTKVLGTSFNIKAYRSSKQMRVTVRTGKVAVATGAPDAGEGMTLVHDQEAIYNSVTGRLTRSLLAANPAMDWKNGSFNFTEESLGDIAIELEHYFNVHIEFKYPGVKKYIISAAFRHTIPLKDMLTTLCLLNQNHFIQIDDQHYVIH